jgi:hypothetical protein
MTLMWARIGLSLKIMAQPPRGFQRHVEAEGLSPS